MKNSNVCLLAVFGIASALVSPRQNVDCPDACTTTGAHVITTRGNWEEPGLGTIGVVAYNILGKCNGSDSQVSGI